MTVTRRAFALRCAVLLTAASTPLARAAAFPDRPLHLIVPFAPGGNVDTTARVVSAGLTQVLGVSAVVENKPGAGGSIGADMVVRAAPDGYTLLVASNGPMTVNPFVQAHLPYDPLRDLAPVGMIGDVPHVLVVTPGLPARTFTELVALSRKRRINTGTSGVGSATHLSLMRLNTASGADLVHVPYRGGGALIPDLVGGTLDATMTELSTALPLHRAGKVRILAVAAARRSAIAADIPTFIESGVKDFTASSYVGLLVPARTPPDAVARLQQGLAASLEMPSVADKLRDSGLETATAAQRTPAGFADFLRVEYQRSKAAAELAGIKPE
ncbi:ABC transporter substrate-binding protein [Bordetella sputigena]|uniref:Bug family tripartite tricarboxylate transporter substrate binding protein n=1 Tax=Bordetella sputigena TaxID=1416810 RepID=UPI0039F123CF